MTNREKLEKEIKMKKLLNIPYDSGEMEDTFSSDTIRLELSGEIQIERFGSSLIYDFNQTNTGQVHNSGTRISDMANRLDPNFIISSRFSAKKEIFDIDFTVNGIPASLSTDNVRLTDSYSGIVNILHKDLNYFLKLGQVPTKLNIIMDIKRSKNPDLRKKYFNVQRQGKTCEEYLNLIFGTELSENRLNNVAGTGRGYWRNPFPRESVKGKIFSMDPKEKAVFLIEYLWGKKLRMACSNSELGRFLASSQNKRWGINDVQLSNKLTHILSYRDYNLLKSDLLALGIKPASNMSRWVKRRGLLTDGL